MYINNFTIQMQSDKIRIYKLCIQKRNWSIKCKTIDFKI